MAWTELPSSSSSPCTQRHPQIGPCWFAAWPDLLTLELFTRALFGSFLRLRKRPEFGTKRPVSAASTGWRSVHSGTLQGATGGTQTHSRRTGSKLGRLHRARQGLVRVPESNTKYGGKGEKTGVVSRRRWCQLSVSPRGFPRGKIIPRGADGSFARCSQGRYLLQPWGCSGETHVRLRRVRAGMPACRRVADAITGEAPILREPPNDSQLSTSHGRRDQKRQRTARERCAVLKSQEIKKCGYGQGCR